MKKLFLFFIMIFALNASMLDFSYLKKAKEAYEKGDFDKAITSYQKIKKPNDEVRFNLADSYYKKGKYQKAAELYKSIEDKKLQFQKLHNLGNCYANLKKIDEGIKAYEKALKIKEDKDTRYNLELLKKMKKKQKQQKKQNKNKKDKKQDKKNRQNSSDDKKQNKKKSDKNKKDKKSKKNKESKNRQNSKKKKNKKRENRQERKKMAKQKSKPKKEPISDMEVRKYNKMLNKRGINTLMLPLETKKGEKHNENIKPW